MANTTLAALAPDMERYLPQVLDAPYGPWDGPARLLGEALLLHHGPARRAILKLDGGFAAVRLPPAGETARLDIEEAPRFASGMEAARFILRERWAQRTAA